MGAPGAFLRARTLTWLLAAASTGAAFPSLVRPSLLTGEPVTIGNVRGTALVVLAVTVPALLAGLHAAGRGSVRGLVVWLGMTIALTYQGMLFCFGIGFGPLFLAYVAMLGLGAWTLVGLMPVLTAEASAPWAAALRPSRFAPRALAGLALANAVVWLTRASPTIWTGEQPTALTGSGLLTSPVWVQDLAFWIPAAVLAAVLALRGNPLGQLLTAGMLAFYVVECLSVASDQWFGARADDTHPDVASMGVVPAAVLLGALILVPLSVQLRILDRAGGRPPTVAVVADPAWRRTLGVLGAVTSAAAVVGTVQLVTGTFTPPVSDLDPIGLDSWALPGLWLAATVAVPCAAVAARAWTRSPELGRTAGVAGLLLLLELVVQVPFVGPDPLQAVMGTVAVTLVNLGVRSHVAGRNDRSGVLPDMTDPTCDRHTGEAYLKHHIP